MPLGPVISCRSADAVLAETLVGGKVCLEVLALGLRTGLSGASAGTDEVDRTVDLSLGIVASAIAVVVHRVLDGTGKPVGDLGLEVHAAHEFMALGLAVVEGLVELGGLLVLVGTTGCEGAVRILADMCRRHHDTTAEDGKVVVGHRVLDRIGEVERRRSGEPLGHVERGIAVHREVIVGAHRHHSFVTHVTDGCCILDILVAAVHTYVLFMI